LGGEKMQVSVEKKKDRYGNYAITFKLKPEEYEMLNEIRKLYFKEHGVQLSQSEAIRTAIRVLFMVLSGKPPKIK